MSRYRWIWRFQPRPGNPVPAERFFDVGILPDGTLHNPRGYPEDEVRAAVLAADARCHERRSRAARKAAETRRHRRDAQVYAAVKRLASGGAFIPWTNCEVCGRGLDDPESIARGIGSDCWQDVLRLLEIERQRKSA
jgi:hypothetical protein